MKKERVEKGIVAALALVIAMLPAAPVAAQLDAAVEGTLESTTDVMVDSDTAMEVDAELEANASVEADVSAQGSMSGEGHMESDSNGSMEGSAKSDTQSTLKVNALGVSVTAAAQVQSEDDLEVLEDNIAIKNKNVAKAEVKSQADAAARVEVVYRHKAKFLGLIPTTIKSKTTVTANAEGELVASTKYSWWSFLASGKTFNRAEAKSRIENNASVKANVSASANAQAQARALEAVIAELDAQAKADGSAKVN